MTTLLNQKKTAELLGVTIRTLERLRTAGLGPRYVKFGSVVRYDLADLESWVESRKRNSTSEPIKQATAFRRPRKEPDNQPAA